MAAHCLYRALPFKKDTVQYRLHFLEIRGDTFGASISTFWRIIRPYLLVELRDLLTWTQLRFREVMFSREPRGSLG
jgi:hypothetical protein